MLRTFCEWVAEFLGQGRPIDPVYGDDVKQLVVVALDQTPETLQIITRALSPETR